MSFPSWLPNLRSALAGGRSRPRLISPQRAVKQRPRLETLEERCLLSFTPIASYAGNFALAADFNNDNIPDLVRNGGSVLLGNGDGTFTPAPGPAVYGTAVGDLDEDGNLDLVGNSATDVTVLMGNGDGTFTPGSGIRVAEPDAWVGRAAVGDFNGDGNLDLGAESSVYHRFFDEWYGYYWGYFTSNAHVLLGDGSGGFSGPNTTELDNNQYLSGDVADINGDGFDDLVTLGGGSVSVLPGNASGFLQSPIGYGAAVGSVEVMAIADLDGDSDTDLVMTDRYGDYTGIRVKLSDGSFSGHEGITDYPIGPLRFGSQTAIAVADFNGDGALDIVTTSNAYDDNGVRTGQLNVLLSYGDGTFAPAATQALTAAVYFVATDDFNSDGLADLTVVAYVSGSSQVNVLLNAGDWNVPATVAIGDATVTEGDSGTVDAVFTVTRKGNLGATVTVPYYTGGGAATAGSDYIAQTGTLTFGPNQTSKTITIKVKGDLIDEYDQVFGVHFNDPTGAIATDRDGFCTILDNDPPPTITITSKVSAKEGNAGTNTLKFLVTLSALSEKEVRVNFATANGTASTADNDYVATSGTLVFSPGQTSKTISVGVKSDKKKESNETFFVNLSSATNATILSFQGIGEILNDDR